MEAPASGRGFFVGETEPTMSEDGVTGFREPPRLAQARAQDVHPPSTLAGIRRRSAKALAPS